MKHKSVVLPEPRCRLGYPQDQVKEITGSRYDEFGRWMRGQTIALCEGTKNPYGCSDPHGIVIYGSDIAQFLRGGPVLD